MENIVAESISSDGVLNIRRFGDGPTGRKFAAAGVAALVRFGRPALGVVVIVAVWAIASASGWVSTQELPGPWVVATTTVDLWISGRLPSDVLVSLARAAIGLGIGTVAGVVLAVVSGFVKVGQDLIDAPLQILRAVPILALTPLAIVWLGIGEGVKIAMVALGTLFPIYLNTYAAIRGTDPRYGELAHMLGLSRWTVIRRIIVPGALPGFFTGLRWAIGLAWVILVFSEQINATSGIGYMTTQAEALNQTNVIVVGLVVYGILGLASDLLVRFVERRVLAWRPVFEAQL
jgi:sulfonate transport system permease protein